jgi:transcriptional regulator with XRE-family HTH domain
MKNSRNPMGKHTAQRAEKSTIIEDFMKTISPETRRSVHKKMEIAVRIEEAMLAKGWTQKEFALRLGKRESEISKWLSGKQNFTVESLCMIEEALGCDIVQIPGSEQAISQRTRDHVATMQREAALWKMPVPMGIFAQKAASNHAISIDHFSLQPIRSYESSIK